MSLNRTLDRLFDEIRREAKRNPDFADRLDAVLRAHDSRRDVPENVLAEQEQAAAPQEPSGIAPRGRGKTGSAPSAPSGAAPNAAAAKPPTGIGARPALNPAGLFKRGGEEALRAALAEQDLGALRALVAEHNLDPGGVTAALTRDELAAHVVAQAKRRAERDDKMFDY